MLSGTRAFAGHTAAQVLSAVLRDDPVPLQQAPSAIERMIRRCLSKNPADRFQTMHEVKASLEGLSKPSPTSTRLRQRKAESDGNRELFGFGRSYATGRMAEAARGAATIRGGWPGWRTLSGQSKTAVD